MAIKGWTGNIKSTSSIKAGPYKYFDRSSIWKLIDNYKYEGEYVIAPSEGNLSFQYVNEKFSHHQKTYRLKSDKLLVKYLFYFLVKNIDKVKLIGNGTTVTRYNLSIYSKLIEPDINVSTQQSIINIIEPFEKLKVNLNNKKMKLIELINAFYLHLSNEGKEVDLLSFATLYSHKYNKQVYYVETSSIDETMLMSNKEKLKNIRDIKKPSRANLSPIKNSLIFTKLIGSNKLFPIYNDEFVNYVYSTGFYNISASDYDWYLFGFLNSNDFLLQKNNNSSGTLMESITHDGLKKVKIKIPNKIESLNSLLELISTINVINSRLDNLIEKLIEIFVL